MAILTSKCAMAELADLASVIAHEIMHDDAFFGIGHCTTEEDANATCVQGLGCCTYVNEFVFMNTLWGKYGTPRSQLPFGLDSERDVVDLVEPTTSRRFDSDSWSLRFDPPFDPEAGYGGCAALWQKASHENFLNAGHEVSVSVDVPDECAR
jgi:hypothetical protein